MYGKDTDRENAPFFEALSGKLRPLPGDRFRPPLIKYVHRRRIWLGVVHSPPQGLDVGGDSHGTEGTRYPLSCIVVRGVS